MDTHINLEEFEEELFRELELRVDKGQEPVRIDKYLVNRIERISRSKFQAAAEAGTLFVNGETVKSNYKVAPNDEIKVVIPLPLGHFGLIAEDIPLDIVYEDHHMMIINKKPGMVVHPGVSNFTGTLVNALLYRI
jgi:23S rRNA pseudouridine1911/1915/1917 synthase